MQLRNLDLNLLLVLDALLMEQSVTRAASKLHVSQPAMSSALRRLRAHFSDELLVTYGRRMALTPFAMRLRTPVRHSIMELQSVFMARSEFDPAHTSGSVLIVASDYVVAVCLAGFLSGLSRIAPELSVDIVHRSLRYAEMFLAGESDLLIVPESRALKGHPHRLVIRDSFCPVVWSGNERVGAELSQKTFLELRHVFPGFGEGRHRSVLQEFLDGSGLEYKTASLVPTFHLVLESVIGTEHVAWAPRKMAELYALRLPIKILATPMKLPPLLETLQWHKQRERDPLNCWLRQSLIDWCAQRALS